MRLFVFFDNPAVFYKGFLSAALIVAVLIAVCLMLCKFCSMMYEIMSTDPEHGSMMFEDSSNEIEINILTEQSSRITRQPTIEEDVDEVA